MIYDNEIFTVVFLWYRSKSSVMCQRNAMMRRLVEKTSTLGGLARCIFGSQKSKRTIQNLDELSKMLGFALLLFVLLSFALDGYESMRRGCHTLIITSEATCHRSGCNPVF